MHAYPGGAGCLLTVVGCVTCTEPNQSKVNEDVVNGDSGVGCMSHCMRRKLYVVVTL